MRYAHFAKMCEKIGKVPNMRQSHIRVFLTCQVAVRQGGSWPKPWRWWHCGPVSVVFTVWHVMQRTVLLSQFCLSFRLSVRRVYGDKSKWWTADILIPHETAITLVYWHQQWFVGDAHSPLESVLKVTYPPPPSKDADFYRLPLITSQP